MRAPAAAAPPKKKGLRYYAELVGAGLLVFPVVGFMASKIGSIEPRATLRSPIRPRAARRERRCSPRAAVQETLCIMGCNHAMVTPACTMLIRA